MKSENNDLAIILAWPDTTIRGDEKWMMWLRKIGVVKNLNFKVGHTGVMLVNPDTGGLLYYDFGRYIAPRGYGRARSVDSDPRLEIHTKASITPHNTIANLEEIAHELHRMSDATQGHGRLFFSVAGGLSFEKAKDYADNLVNQGSMLYGAIARGNNNCSRFITRLLVHASDKYHVMHGLRYPETIKSSPLSNVVNVRKDRDIYLFDAYNGLRPVRMSRWDSFVFLFRQLKGNLQRSGAVELPEDITIGSVDQKTRPDAVPPHAQWLGGVGEGAWYCVDEGFDEDHYLVSRYTETGQLEYKIPFRPDKPFDALRPFQIAYDSHRLATTVLQQNERIRMYPVECHDMPIPDGERMRIDDVRVKPPHAQPSGK